MRRLKKVLSIILIVSCLMQTCFLSFPALAEQEQKEINTISSEGLVVDNKSDWSYVAITGTTETPMVYSASASGVVIDNPAANDQYAKFTTVGNGNSHPANSCDIAMVYNVKADGVLDLGLATSIHNTGGDGVKVRIYLNTTSNELLAPTVVQKADGKKEFSVASTTVKAGDKIYFVLNKNNTLSTDGGTFAATVKSVAEQEPKEINTVSSEGLVAGNKSDWSYVAIAGTTETPMVYSASASGVVIDNPATNDQYAKFTTAGNGNSHPANSCDIAIVYNVKTDGVLDLGLAASIHNTGGDGVKVRIYLNTTSSELLAPTVVQKADGKKKFSVANTTVKAGDKIYFVLNKNNTLSTDGGTFVATVKSSAEQEPDDEINTKSTDGIVADNKSDWSYVAITGTTETLMVYGKYSNTYPAMLINNPATNDQYARFLSDGGSHPSNSGDIAAVYHVKKDAVLDCSITAKVNSSASDGVRIKAWVNSKENYILAPTVINATEGEVTYDIPSITVKTGDKIYFALDKNSGLSNDAGKFIATVKEGSKVAVDKEYMGNVMAPQAEYGYSYQYITEDGSQNMMSYETASSAYMNGYSGKAYTTADDVTAYFNDKGQVGAATTGYVAQVYNVSADGKINVSFSAKTNNTNTYNGDGYGIALAINDCMKGGLEDWTYFSASEAKSGAEKQIQKSIQVKAGDKIYFLFTKNGGTTGEYKASYDTAILKTVVSYSELVSVKEEDRTIGDVELIKYEDPNTIKVGKTYKSSENINSTQLNGFSFKTVTVPQNEISDMLYDEETQTYRKSLDKSHIDYWAYFGKNVAGSSNEGDTLTVYTMPQKAKISVEVLVKVSREQSDGVAVSIARGELVNVLHKPQVVTYSQDAQVTSIKKELIANQGDDIFVRLNKNVVNSYDTVQFDVIITYLELEPEENATDGEYVHPLVNTKTDFKTALSKKELDVWSYKKLNIANNQISDMSYEYANNNHTYRCSLDPEHSDYWGSVDSTGVIRSAVSYDVLIVYTAPEKVKINATWNAEIAREQSDGAVFSVFKNAPEYVIGEKQVLRYEDGKQALVYNDLVLNKGDKLYFRLNKNISNSYDSIVSNIIIECLEVNPKEQATEGTYVHPLTGTTTDFKSSLSVNEKGVWSYKKIKNSNGKISNMSYEYTKKDNRHAYRCSLDKKDVDYWGSVDSTGVISSANTYDVLIVYTAPEKVKINATWNAEIAREQSDGAVFSVFRNKPEYIIGEKQVLRYEDGKQALEYNNLVLNKGDKLYFRLNKNISNSYDSIVSNIIIECLEVNPKEQATEGTYVHPLTGTTTDFKSSLSVNEKGVWSYKKIKNSNGEISNMSYEYTKKDNRHAYRCSLDNKDVDYWGSVDSTGVISSANTYDVLIVYTAPEKVKVNATWNAEIAREKSDGAVFSVFRNEPNTMIGKRSVLRYKDGKESLQYNNIILNKGDKLYFRLNKKGTNSYDSIISNIIIKYLEINPKGVATKGTAGVVIEEGTEILFNQDATDTWGENGFYYYAAGIGTDDYYKLVYDQSIDNYALPKGTMNDEWARIGTTGNIRTGNKYDSVLVYQIQKDAQITVSVTCKSLATNGDGVRVKLLRNGQKIAPLGQRWQVVDGTSQFGFEQKFNVAKGEYIMLRVNRNFLNSYDNLDLDFSITYNKLFETAPENSIKGVQLPTCLPYVKELATDALNDPSHVNRTPFEGEVPGLKGKAKVVEPVSAKVPTGYGNLVPNNLILIICAIGIAILLGGGYILILRKRQKKHAIDNK